MENLEKWSRAVHLFLKETRGNSLAPICHAELDTSGLLLVLQQFGLAQVKYDLRQ